jgi:hypothetical protein
MRGFATADLLGLLIRISSEKNKKKCSQVELSASGQSLM